MIRVRVVSNFGLGGWDEGYGLLGLGFKMGV